MRERQRFDWIEFKVRPKKDGIHDSGYRFLQVTGCRKRPGAQLERVELNQWADNIRLNGPVSLDVTEDGRIRLWMRSSDGVVDTGFPSGSDAEFRPTEMARALSYLASVYELQGNVDPV